MNIENLSHDELIWLVNSIVTPMLTQQQQAEVSDAICEIEANGIEFDYDSDSMSDAEADADTLRLAGWGTDEDYGFFGYPDEY